MTAPLHTRFDGWVMINEYSEGVLLVTDIEAIDTDHQDAPMCDNEHGVARMAAYALVSPEASDTLCAVCVLKLVEGAAAGGYVIGALPAN